MSTLLTSSEVTFHSGETVSIPITVLDDDDVAVELAGATIKFAIVRKIGDASVISTEASPMTATSAITSNGASPEVNNIVTISISATNTEPLIGVYHFECRAIDGASNEAVIAYGSINFKQNQIT